MNDKVNVECPHCGSVITVSISDLTPGMWYECLNCHQKIRITNQDINHLLEAIHRKRGQRGSRMKSQIFRGKWDQIKGLAKEFWGELTGDELDFIAGQRERLIGKLEEKYNITRAEAEKQVEEFERKL